MTTEIEPLPGPQEEFLSRSEDVVFYGGAAGGGKTTGLLLDPLRGIHKPKFRAIIFRRQAVDITNPGGLWDEAQELYGQIGGRGVSGPPQKWVFPSGAVVHFRHLNLEKTRKDYQGAQVDFLGFDELTHFTERQFTYLLSRARSRTDGVQPWVRATMNPDVNSWVLKFVEPYLDDEGYPDPERVCRRRHFIRRDGDLRWTDGAPDEEGIPPKSFTFVPADVTDNPVLLDRNPQYVADLKAQRRTEQERLLEGCWYASDADGLFRHHSIQIKQSAPHDVQWLRYWDLADTDESDADDDGARTAGARLDVVYRAWSTCPRPDCRGWAEGKHEDGCPRCGADFQVQRLPVIVVGHVTARRLEGADKHDWMRRTAELDGIAPQYLEQEGGASGKETVRDYRRHHLPDSHVEGHQPRRSKVERAENWVGAAEQGRVWLLAGEWNQQAIDEIERFPDEPVDIVDAISGGVKVAEKTAKDTDERGRRDSSSPPERDRTIHDSSISDRRKYL